MGKQVEGEGLERDRQRHERGGVRERERDRKGVREEEGRKRKRGDSSRCHVQFNVEPRHGTHIDE